MPELPEVETMRRGIHGAVGSRILGVSFPRCRFRPIHISPSRSTLRRRMTGRCVADTQRLGKRIVVKLDSDDAIVFEPRMAGLVLLTTPPDSAHLRFGLQLSYQSASHLWYWDRRGLGSVRLLSSSQLAQEFGPERLGPDAMLITLGQLRRRLAHSRRAIKVALLDQRAVAGIGNLYASEILHVARVHPQLRCDCLDRAAWKRLHVAMTRILTDAIECEGSTLSDGAYRNVLNQTGRYQAHHRVYSRHGQPCLSCGRGPIQRLVQGQRSTYFCPRCQPDPIPASLSDVVP